MPSEKKKTGAQPAAVVGAHEGSKTLSVDHKFCWQTGVHQPFKADRLAHGKLAHGKLARGLSARECGIPDSC